MGGEEGGGETEREKQMWRAGDGVGGEGVWGGGGGGGGKGWVRSGVESARKASFPGSYSCRVIGFSFHSFTIPFSHLADLRVPLVGTEWSH